MRFRYSSENNLQSQLSMKEMLDISHEITQLYTPDIASEEEKEDFKLPISRKELVEISQQISLYYAPKRLLDAQKLVILPIDPQHFYIYWDLGKNQAPSLSEKLLNKELSLKVFSRTDFVHPVFETTIDELQSGKIITFPQTKKTSVYSAEIGKIDLEKKYISLIKSNTTYAIHVKEDDTMLGMQRDYKNPQFIDFVTASDFLSKELKINSCFAYSNPSAKGKKNN